MPRIVIAKAEHRQRDRLRHDHQKRVLKEQRVAFDLPAIDQLQELRPQLPLQCDRRIAFTRLPNRPKTVVGAPKRHRVVTELQPNGDRVGSKRVLERHGAVEPRQKNVRLVGIERRVLQLDELIAAALEHDPLETVGSDADEAFALLALAVGEIIRHAPDHVVPFLVEIPLGLEYGPADQSIEPTPHLGNAALEIERPELDAEFLHQQLAEIRLHLVVTRTGGKMMQKRAGTRIIGQESSLDRDECDLGCDYQMSLITAWQARLMLLVCRIYEYRLDPWKSR